jgi:hypothetical protein
MGEISRFSHLSDNEMVTAKMQETDLETAPARCAYKAYWLRFVLIFGAIS